MAQYLGKRLGRFSVNWATFPPKSGHSGNGQHFHSTVVVVVTAEWPKISTFGPISRKLGDFSSQNLVTLVTASSFPQQVVTVVVVVVTVVVVVAREEFEGGKIQARTMRRNATIMNLKSTINFDSLERE